MPASRFDLYVILPGKILCTLSTYKWSLLDVLQGSEDVFCKSPSASGHYAIAVLQKPVASLRQV